MSALAAPLHLVAARARRGWGKPIRGYGRARRARRAESVRPGGDGHPGALAEVGLGERLDQRVERLSAGEAQRVALARALVSADGLLVLDEPTSLLDAESAGTSPNCCPARPGVMTRPSSARRTTPR